MSDTKAVGLLAVVVGVVIALVVAACLVYPQYGVYYQRLAGEAKLREAESSRQIAVEEAKAKLESSEMLAKARVIDAKGTADAIGIVGEALDRNPSYIDWEFVQKVMDNDNQVIYLPTEGGMPILEAGRLGALRAKKSAEQRAEIEKAKRGIAD